MPKFRLVIFRNPESTEVRLLEELDLSELEKILTEENVAGIVLSKE